MSNSFEYLTKGSEEEKKLTSDFLSSLKAIKSLSAVDFDIVDKIIESLAATGKMPFDWSPQEDGFLSTHDQSMWLDYLVYRYKLRVYPKEKIVAEFPVYVLIEPTSICNFRCGFCFQADNTFNKKSTGYMGHMSMDIFRNTIDQCVAGGTKAITLASRGEPTICPDLSSMLNYVSGKFLEVKLNTNGSLLSPELNESILNSVDELVFSIDAGDKPTYEKLRVNGKFEKTLANVMQFQKQREGHASPKTHTRISGVNIGQDSKLLVDVWGQHVDHVGVTPCEERWDTYNNEIHPDKTHPCEYLFERMYVWWNGDVGVCDVDYKNVLMPGNVNKHSIKEIWHGEKYQKLRDAHIAGDRGQFLPCDRCGV